MIAIFPTQWKKTTDRPPLAANEIHVWATTLDVKDETLGHLRSYLTEAEHQKAQRLRLAVYRNRYIAARGILRWLLGGYLDIYPGELRFLYGALGKPSLPGVNGDPALEFNATDSQAVGLFAFSQERELGIDVECIPRALDHEQIANRKFAPVEARTLLDLPEAARQEAFLACWTRKEAYGKALGVGIRYPLHEVILCKGLGDATLTVVDEKSRRWILKQIRLDAMSIASLVVAGRDDWRLKCFHIDPLSL